MSKHVVVAFGRMNPPTSGHEKLLDSLHNKAKEVGGEAHLHLSQSTDAKKNPLSHDDKVSIAKKLLPKHAGIIRNEKHVKTFIDVLKHHSNKDHEIHIMAGGDRVEEYKKLANKYNGSEFHYKKIHVHSAGDRDPDAEGTEGMSASKMREHAKNNDLKSFHSGLPSGTSSEDAKHVFSKVRKGMKLEESKFEGLVRNKIMGDAPERETCDKAKKRRAAWEYLHNSLTEAKKKVQKEMRKYKATPIVINPTKEEI